MANVPVTVVFSSTEKRTNSTKKVTGGESIGCFLKDRNSIIEPELLVRKDNPTDIFKWNYFTIPDYNNRGYFVTDIISETSKLWWVKGQVDVLGTYHDQIMETDAFVMYSKSRYNSMIPDERVKVTDRSEIHAVEQTLNWASETGCYILTVVSRTSDGTTGPAQAYIMDKAGLSSVSQVLNSDQWMQQVLEWLTGDPFDAIVSCMWCPFNMSQVAHGGSTIEPFGFPLGAGLVADLYTDSTLTIEPYIPYVTTYFNPETGAEEHGWADFRNVEPYTEYFLWLPGAGLVQIPMVNLIGYGTTQPKFNITTQISVPTGEVHYSVHRINDVKSGSSAPSDKILEVKGNLGVSIPVSNRSGGFVTGLQRAIGAATSLGLSMSTSGLWSGILGAQAVEQGASMTASMHQHNTNIEGNLGGWLLNDEELTRIVCITRQFLSSDSPSNLARTVGRPLFATCRLGDLSGITRCSGAYVEAEGATQFEQERLSQLINSSTNFIYGGVIIE